MTTITRNATRITDIDASIDRLKIAMTYLADKSTTGILAERMADLIIERQSLLTAKVAQIPATPKAPTVKRTVKPKAASKPVAAPTVLEVAPVQSTPKAPKAVKSADKRNWRTDKPSAAQIGRVERAEEAILASGRKRGIKLILTGAERKTAVKTAGATSDYYKTLATFTRAHGISF